MSELKHIKCENCGKEIEGEWKSSQVLGDVFIPAQAYLITSQKEKPKLICKECNTN